MESNERGAEGQSSVQAAFMFAIWVFDSAEGFEKASRSEPFPSLKRVLSLPSSSNKSPPVGGCKKINLARNGEKKERKNLQR